MRLSHQARLGHLSRTMSTSRASDISSNLTSIQSRIQSSTPTSSSQPVTLIAVSKLKPLSDIIHAYRTGGQCDFGENYVQELEGKVKDAEAEAEGMKDVRWHFIGPLQSNKAKTLAGAS